MKTFFQNRKGLKICILVEEAPNAKGLIFIMHGLGSNRDRPTPKTIAEVFVENGYTAVRFDASNSTGESEGKYEDQTITTYYHDLEDVIAWAKNQSWYMEPFILEGSSLGGITTALYAENFPEKIKALAPVATVVSGQLSAQVKDKKGELENWKTTGWQIKEHPAKLGLTQKLPWSHMEDRLQYDLLPKADQLSMPVLLIVGEKDDVCPLEQQQLLYKLLPGKKELQIIKGSPHSFQQPEHLRNLKMIFNDWIKTL